MSSFLLDEDEDSLDEIPVHASFFSAVESEDPLCDVGLPTDSYFDVDTPSADTCQNDPLLLDHQLEPVNNTEPLPLQDHFNIAPPTSRSQRAAGRQQRNEKQVSEKPTPPPPAAPPPNPALETPLKKSSLLIPPQYVSMSFQNFSKEMEQNIHDIIQESISLLQKDPREYHPFYLRMFKYVTIGQQLGYVDPRHVHDIWEGFSNFAKTQFDLSKEKPIKFTGERSPYATYILTKKVVIGDKVVSRTCDEKERNHKFRKLEGAAERIQNNWKLQSSGDDIRKDLGAKLQFFNECKTITFPSDVIRVNNLWTKFLNVTRNSGGKKKGPSTQKKPETTKETPPSMVPKIELVDPEEKESRKSVKKLIKVIVAPSKSPQQQPESPLSPPANDSPPNSPPPCSPQPQISDDKTDKAKAPTPVGPQEKKKLNIKVLSSKSPPAPAAVNKRKIPPSRTVKRSNLKLLKKKTPFPVTPSSSTKLGAFKKLKLLSTIKKLQSTSPDVFFQRRLKLEKLINSKSKASLLAIKTKKTPNSKVQAPPSPAKPEKNAEPEPVKDIEEGPPPPMSPPSWSPPPSPTAPDSAPSSPPPVASPEPESEPKTDDQKTVQKNRLKRALTNCTKTSIPPRKVSFTNNSLQKRNLLKKQALKKNVGGANVNLERQIKLEKKISSGSKALKKKDRCPTSPEKTLNQDKVEVLPQAPDSSNDDDKMVMRGKSQLEGKKEVWKYYYKYRTMRCKCPVCDERITIGGLQQHLRNVHEIIEDDDLWSCHICQKFCISRREGWLGHLDMFHAAEGKVNMEEMIQVAKKTYTKEDWKELTVKLGLTLKEARPNRSTQPKTQPTSRSRFQRSRGEEMCDECGKVYLKGYIPFHKDAVHNPNKRLIQCPSCPISCNPKSIWNHYCTFHLVEGHKLERLDPVNAHPELKRDPLVSSKFEAAEKAETTQAQERSTTCDQCGKEFWSPINLKRHLKMMHMEVEKHICPGCGKEFKSKDSLGAHYRRIHEGTVKSKCPHCSKDLQSAGKLWRHMIDAHGVTPTEAASFCEVTFVQCTYCGLELQEGKPLNNHMRNEHPEHLESHMASIREAGYYERKLERARIRKKNQRIRLKETGIGPNWMKKQMGPKKDSGECPECKKKLRRGLVHHRSVVHGINEELTEVCTFEGCGARFRKKKFLRVHWRRVHTEEMDKIIVDKKIVKVVEKTALCTVYTCTLCDQYLHHLAEIKVHMVAFHPDIFTEEGGPSDQAPVLVKCPHCPLDFGSTEEARNHVEECHLELCWRCPECSKAVLDPNDLGKHFMEDHGMEDGGNVEGDGGMEEEEEGQFLTLKASRGFREVRREAEVEDNINNGWCKYRRLPAKCKICEKKMTVFGLSYHFRDIHGIDEDGDMLTCKLCDPENKFSKHGRPSWLWHMERMHENEVNIEQLIEMVGKPNTKQDWRTLKIKNAEPVLKKFGPTPKKSGKEVTPKAGGRGRGNVRPQRRPVGRTKNSRQKEPELSSGPEIEESDEAEEEEPVPSKKGRSSASTTTDVAPSRSSRRSVGRKNYAAYFEYKSEEEEDDDERKSRSLDKNKRRARIANVPVVPASLLKNMNSGAKRDGIGPSLSETIELKKRLIIKLVGLSEEEISWHLSKKLVKAADVEFKMEVTE